MPGGSHPQNGAGIKQSRSIATGEVAQQKSYTNMSTPNRPTSGTIQSTSAVRKTAIQPILMGANSATNLNSKYNYDYGMPQNNNSMSSAGYGAQITKSPMTESKQTYTAVGRTL